jgi:peroxiredoxin (alkyl hydroperoxide reductase subunit C)
LSIAKAEVLRYGGKKSIFIPEDSMKFSTGIVVLLLAMAISGVSFAAAVSNIHPGGQGLPGYEVGSPAPTFSLDAVVNQEFKKVSLSDYQGKWVLLFFYPGDFTFVCPTEIKGFNKALSEFTTANTQVLAVSVDSKFSHLAWVKSGALDKLEFPLISDFSKQTARSYGVLDEEKSTARRGLFIIDPNGVIQYRIVHSDKVGRSVEETLRVLKALQTEELCPINWKPGDRTIK